MPLRLSLPHRSLLISFIIVIFSALTFSILTPQVAHAAAYVVDTTSDAGFLTSCTAAANDCSLRGAVLDALIAGGGTITFDSSVFTSAATGTITLSTPLTTISSNITITITITGLGADKVIIDGNANSHQVFIVNSGGTLNLSDLTIQNAGTPFGDGGAIANNGGTVTVTNCVFSNNTANGGGGGISSINGTLSVSNSTFSGNQAALNSGGGIDSQLGPLTVVNSTFSGNSAGSGGGGLRAASGLTVVNSTFSGNSAGSGGGIESDGTATITNSTFTGNSASNSNDGSDIVHFGSTPNVIMLNNSILANSVSGHDCAGLFFSELNHTLIEDGSCGAAPAQPGSGNLTGDPKLDTAGLKDNGGSTQTIALQSDSPAINVGSNALAVDQNGDPLMKDEAGNDRIIGGTVDMGAFESSVLPSALLSATKTVSGTFEAGQTVTYTVTILNSGTGAQADNLGHEFTDVLPSQLTLVDTGATSGTAVATTATNTVTWDGAIAASGGTVTVTIHATINAGISAGQTVSNQGTLSYDSDGNGTNDATAVTDDPGVGGASDPTVFTGVAPGVSVTIDVGPTPIPAQFFQCENLATQSSGAITSTGGISAVHSGDQFGNIYCHIIAKDGSFVTSSQEIGIESVLNLGVQQAVDVFGELPGGYSVVPFDRPIQICLRGTGEVLFLNAANAKRTVERLTTVDQNGYLCVQVAGAGTVVLVQQASGAAQVPAPPTPMPESESLTNCRVTTTHSPLNLRAEPGTDGQILAQLPYGITLTATERVPGWYRVIYLDGQGWVSESYLSFAGDCGQ